MPPEALVQSYRRLAEVFHHVLSEQSLDTLLERIADTLTELIPYDGLSVYQADVPQRLLVPVLARDKWAENILNSRSHFGEGITGWAVEHRQPVLTNRAHLDPRVKVVPGTPADEPEALISIPLVARGSLKGALNIYRLGEEAAFVEEEFELAKWFGDAAALALDNAQVRAGLEFQAQTDSLTGLYNHRYFHDRLRAELTRASRSHDSVAVLMLDIDDFKKVNDVHGHGSGDQVLSDLAELLKATLRASDFVCRLGGEEFGVVMTSCDAGDALGLASRLTDRLAETEFDPAGKVTVSIGISQGPEHAMNPRELVACAEAAMMTAKARGKNQVVLFDDESSERPDGASLSRRDVRSIAHLKLLQSLAGKLNRLNDVRRIGNVIADELRLLIDYHNCRVYIAHGDELVPIAFRGELDSATDASVELPSVKVGEGITGRAAATAQSQLIPNALECEFATQIPGTHPIEESFVAVPLCYGSRVIGTVAISKLGSNQFDEDDVRLLEVLAGHASVALENARLYESQRQEAENLKDLLGFGEALSKAPSFQAIADETVRLAARLFDSEQSCLWLESSELPDFRCAAHVGYPEAEPFVSAQVDRAQAERLVGRRRAPFTLSAATARRALPEPSGLTPSPLAIAPLSDGDELRGWVAVRLPRAEFGHRTAERLRLMAGLADQASVALQKARLYTEEKESADTARALLEFSRELATAHGIDEVLDRIVELSGRILGSPRTSVWLQEPDGGDVIPKAIWGYERDDRERVLAQRFKPEVAETLPLDGDPFVFRAEDLSKIEGAPAQATSSSFAIAPLRLDAGRLGCIVAASPDGDETEFAETKLRLLAGIAHQAKLAITNAGSFEGLESTFLSTIEALANALEANDEYTSTHARSITDMALEVGAELGLDTRDLKRLELGALFHDIGKIGIPAHILSKPGPLNEQEREIIELHPELGEKILAPIERLADVRMIVRNCHERFDGKGYPDRKAGEAIPIESRIILVCDAFHAMTTDRPYRKRLSVKEACRRLRQSAGTQFDPKLVSVFLRLVRERPAWAFEPDDGASTALDDVPPLAATA